MNEVWRPVEDYEGLYEISNYGNVKSLSRKVFVTNKYNAKSTRKIKSKILIKQYIGTYYVVSLCKNGKYKQHYIHRLVATSFLENKNNYNYINHKDENKLNNFVDNLEWCTQKYNCNYGNRNKIVSEKKKNKPIKNFKRVGQFDFDNNLIKEYKNIFEAYKETNKNMTDIKKCCEGKRKKAGNYIWKYI